MDWNRLANAALESFVDMIKVTCWILLIAALIGIAIASSLLLWEYLIFAIGPLVLWVMFTVDRYMTS